MLAKRKQQGIAGRTYWICAFAVNQHAGICENSGGDRDSWTGQVLKPMELGSDFTVLQETYLGILSIYKCKFQGNTRNCCPS